MTQIMRCKVEKILGVNCVEFVPNGQSVTIGGKNGQGKSSAIWALAMALGGKKQIPEMPVHKGAESGRVTIELDKFIVEMRVDSDRDVKLTVETKEGIRFATPRKILDELFGNLSFDPGEFRTFERERRVKTFLDLAGIDPSQIDTEIKKLAEERKMVGREYEALKIQIGMGPVTYDDVPSELINIDKLLEQLRECQDVNRELFKMEVKVGEYQGLIVSITDENRRIINEMEILRLRMAENEKARDLAEENIKIIEAAYEESILKRDTRAEADRINEELKTAESTNSHIRANQAVRDLHARFEAKGKEFEALDGSVATLKAKREELISSASLPITGLSFADGDVTFGGVPFAQLSESEQWKVSTAIGFALNKNGIVFVRQSGGLDKDSRQAIREHAAACGVQLFLEVVDDADDVQVVIEGGEVRENRLETVFSNAVA